jgi:ParB family transcriptional regulator, chromosome partitioning protein
MAKIIKKQALGRGLSALLKDPENNIESIEDKNADKVVGNIIELEINSIELNPFQPRSNFNEETLQELSISIRELGVIQPITVRKLEFNKYQLISGERRLRAAKIAGLEHIPAFIRIANDQESLTMALVENIQRHDLDPIEIALSYQRLMEEINLTQEQMSERVGKKRSTITNYLRLLKLDPVIQTGIRDGFISMGHGKAIIGIENHDEQAIIYQKIVLENLSVRETEALVKVHQESKNQQDISNNQNEIFEKVDYKSKPFSISLDKKQELDYHFNTKIDVNIGANGKGKITIPFKNESDFNRILNLLKQ